MSIIDNLYEGVRCGLNLFNTEEGMYLDEYTNGSNRITWYVDDKVSFTADDLGILFSSEKDSIRVWKEDIDSFVLRVEDDCSITLSINSNFGFTRTLELHGMIRM